MTLTLRLYSVLNNGPAGPKPADPILTKQESKVLNFLEVEIYSRRHSPSVRDVSRALGLRSSRSGARILQSLMSKGLAYRCRHGKLGLSNHLHSSRREV